MVNGQSLVITNVTEKDDGVYACIASNAVGKASFDVRLNVHSEYIINDRFSPSCFRKRSTCKAPLEALYNGEGVSTSLSLHSSQLITFLCIRSTARSIAVFIADIWNVLDITVRKTPTLAAFGCGLTKVKF